MLDSETTGLAPPVQFTEIAIVDADAKPLFEDTLRPVCWIEASAMRVHAHTARGLAASPPFLAVYPDLLEALWRRRVIVYNASYDRRIGDGEVRTLGAGSSPARAPCLGVRDEALRRLHERGLKAGGYRSQKLPGGDHSALGDALSDAAADRGHCHRIRRV